jgi:hypothetical protein
MVDRPVEDLVHPSLRSAWKISNDLAMWYIFDVVSPARRFKRNTPYTEEADFADYGPQSYEDLTETDGEKPGWMPYKPPAYKCVHVIHLRFGACPL